MTDAQKEFLIILLILLFVFLGLVWRAHGQESLPASEQIIHAIIGEAAGESFGGQIAVACGIKNRPEGLQGVIGAKMTRIPTSIEWGMAREALDSSNNLGACDFLGGADMWCSNLEVCNKAWMGVPMIFIGKIGDHYFYRRLTNDQSIR